MFKKSLKFFLFALMLVAAVSMFGCGSDGSDGAQGPEGPPGPAGPGLDPATVEPEVCQICHRDTDQVEHQAIYDKYKDASTLEVTIDSIDSTQNADGTYDAELTFTVTENGAPYTGDAASLAQHSFFCGELRRRD